jgi:hypothetical protein
MNRLRSGKVTKLWQKLIPDFMLRMIVIGIVLSIIWGWLVYIFQSRQMENDLYTTIFF